MWCHNFKTRAYFKRYQVAFRRRREGYTDYVQRKNLIIQDKSKFLTPRYRLVVRRSNTNIICQIASADVDKDRILCAANSFELPRYGVKVGLTNFSAAYCTGLLVARRLLHKLSEGEEENALKDLYPGVEVATGEEYHVEDEERSAFRCFLDVGLARTSLGANVFGALKGAVDGGLNIPHSMRRFPGYDAATKEFKAEILRDRIFGKHVANYMTYLKEEDEEKYKRQFSQYIANGIDADNIEEMYTKAHEAIRANPEAVKREGEKTWKVLPKTPKQTLAARKNRIQQRSEERV